MKPHARIKSITQAIRGASFSISAILLIKRDILL
jgi:hypothetical protein